MRGGDNSKLQRSAIKQSKSSMNPHRPNTDANGKKLTHLRTKSTILRLKMYKSGGKAIRNTKGQIVQAAPFQSTLKSGTMARIEPNRKWFGNTKVIGQTQLDAFRTAMSDQINNPYKVVLKSAKLPMSLLKHNDLKPVDDKKKVKVSNCVMNTNTNADFVYEVNKPKILDIEPFDTVIGGKSIRKRPSINIPDLDHLAKAVDELPEREETVKSTFQDKYYTNIDSNLKKGQSRRIWGELYKVVDASDIIVHALDARDPEGTRVRHIEEHITKNKAHKHLIFLLNKCDLVPVWATRRWIQVLSMDHPTVAFHASLEHSFGKSSLISLLRQFARLHPEKRQLSVGFIGYPNVGKSSIINTLRGKKVCNVAPIPGETKVWNYIKLFRRMYLIDCPGIVHATGVASTVPSHMVNYGALNEEEVSLTQSENYHTLEVSIVLRGATRIETLSAPSLYIPSLLTRTNPKYIQKLYGVNTWVSADDLLEQIAKKTGRLLKAGEPDVETVAKQMLYDWQRGNIPNFILPSPEQLKAAEEKARELGLYDGKMTRMEKEALKQKKKGVDGRISKKAKLDDADANEVDAAEIDEDAEIDDGDVGLSELEEGLGEFDDESLSFEESKHEEDEHGEVKDLVAGSDVDWDAVYARMDEVDRQGHTFADSEEERLVNWVDEDEEEANTNNNEVSQEELHKNQTTYYQAAQIVKQVRKRKRTSHKEDAEGNN